MLNFKSNSGACWHMNATLEGANLHPGVNLHPGENLHPGANCAYEHGFSLVLYTEYVIL